MDINQIISDTILNAATQYPVVTTVLVVLGIARAVNKPLFACIKAYVESTESKNDDLFLVEVETSKLYKALTFVLDWTASIKLPAKTVAITPLPVAEEKAKDIPA